MVNIKKAIISILIMSTALFAVACKGTDSVESSNGNIESSTSNIETSTSNTEAPTSNTEAPTSNIEAPTSNTEYDTNSLINIVRNGSLFQYPSIPLKKAFASFIGNLEWDALTDETGSYVSASGNITVYDEETYVTIVYGVDPEKGVFTFDSTYLDGTEVNEFFYKLLEYRIMDQYIYGDDTIENHLINFVKNGTLYDYEDIPLGFAIENWFGNPTWEAIVADDDNYYINIRGTVMQYGEYTDAILQYLVNLDDDTFSFYALEVDDVPQSVDVYSTAIADMMENIENYLS